MMGKTILLHLSTFFLVFVNLAIIVQVTLTQTSDDRKSEGCTAEPLLADQRPFAIVWNHPTWRCEERGIHLDFDKWGILDNSKDRFFGQEIALFYNLGKFPYLDKANKSINGGIPQLGNLQAHLTKMDDDLKTHVWKKEFDGLGVIDMEYWRPLYKMNFYVKRVYQQKSVDLVKSKHPDYSPEQLEEEAIKEFNQAAKQFIGQTLEKVKSKRPNGKWGYYLFPRCFDPKCNGTTLKYNDRIWWLFANSTALYPSIYFSTTKDKTKRARLTKQTLHEAFRVKAKYSSQDIPVMPYAKTQSGPYTLYQKEDLAFAIRQPADMGASGVVLWGSSHDAVAKNECTILKDYVNDVLGPFSQRVNYFFGNCTQELCSGHGRCVRVDYEQTYQHYLRESGRTECQIADQYLQSRKQLNLNPESQIQLTLAQNYPENNSGGIVDKISRKYFNPAINIFKNNMTKWSPSIINVLDEPKKQNIEFEIKFSSTQHDKFGSNNRLNYDFDDYVCKCYHGYSGQRCENRV